MSTDRTTDKTPIKKDRETGIYYANFTFNGSRYRHTLKTSSKLEALNLVNKLIEQLKSPINLFDFKTACIKFLEEKQSAVKSNMLRYKTYVSYKDNLKPLLEYFENYLLENITPLRIKDYVFYRKLQKSNDGKIKAELTTLSILFNIAIQNEMISKNPVFGIKKSLQAYQPRKAILDINTLNLILENSNIYLRRLLIFLLETGCRITEVLKSTFEDLLITKDKLYFLKIRAEISKNKKSRLVPLSTKAIMQLMEQKKEFPDTQYLFTNSKGENYKTTPKTALANACRKSNIKPCGFHIFRHTFATNQYNSGNLELEEIKDVLGHQDIKLTKNIYIENDMLKIAKKLN